MATGDSDSANDVTMTCVANQEKETDVNRASSSSTEAPKYLESAVLTGKKKRNTKVTRFVITSKDDVEAENMRRKAMSFDVQKDNKKIGNGVMTVVGLSHNNEAIKSSVFEITAKYEGKETEQKARGFMTMLNMNRKDGDSAVKKHTPPIWNDITAVDSKLTFTTPVTFTSLDIPVLLDKTRAKVAAPAAEPDGSFVRSPICCILGQADVGKTKLLDGLRGTNDTTNVQDGCSPQTVSVTALPAGYMQKRTEINFKMNFGSLVLIDIPGHESVSNLPVLGSGLCDFAILVVDIMHGLQPQTIEYLNLLKLRNTKFFIALSKLDNLPGWKTNHDVSFMKEVRQQAKEVTYEFSLKIRHLVAQLKEHGFYAILLHKTKDISREIIHLVPTSASRGDGTIELMRLLVDWINRNMLEKIAVTPWSATDVVSVNGMHHQQQENAVYILQGPVATAVRVLLANCPVNPALEDTDGWKDCVSKFLHSFRRFM